MSSTPPLSYTTVRPQTAGNIVYDSGYVVVNINESILRSTGSLASATASTATWVDPNGTTVAPFALGATQGGNIVKLNKTERIIKVDGARLEYKGLSRISMIAPSLECSLLEMADPTTLQYALGSSTEYNWPASGSVIYNEYVPNLVVVNSDFIGNIAVIVAIGRSSAPKIYILRNVRVQVVGENTLKDDAELALKCTFQAHALLTNPTLCPYSEYIPVYTGS